MNLLCDANISEGSSEQLGVDASQEQLGPAVRQLESELCGGRFPLSYQSMEEWVCLKLRNLWEGHPHETVRSELIGFETSRILRRRSNSLVGRLR